MKCAYFQMAPNSTNGGVCYVPALVKGIGLINNFNNYIKKLESYAELKFDKIYKLDNGIKIGSGSYTYQSLGGLTLDPVKGGGNGRVEIKDFESKLFTKVNESSSGILHTDFPDDFLFSVVDHNSAHHMSSILARRCFENNPGKGNRVVINFDQHDDWARGKDSGTQISCGRFGKYLIQNHYADAYVTIGIGTSGSSGTFVIKLWVEKGEHTVDYNKSALYKGNIHETHIKNIMNRILKICSIGQFYITVDRDCMKGSCTPYGDGAHEAKHIRQIVKECINFLKTDPVSAKLVGFDVTGLPMTATTMSTTPSKCTSYSFPNDKNSIAHAFNDVKLFYSYSS